MHELLLLKRLLLIVLKICHCFQFVDSFRSFKSLSCLLRMFFIIKIQCVSFIHTVVTFYWKNNRKMHDFHYFMQTLRYNSKTLFVTHLMRIDNRKNVFFITQCFIDICENDGFYSIVFLLRYIINCMT